MPRPPTILAAAATVLLAGGAAAWAQVRSTPPDVDPSPNICLAGTGSIGWCGDGGPARRAKLAAPRDVAVAADGSLVVADTGNQVIRRIAPDGTIATIAGFGVRGAAVPRVSARRARFRNPAAVAVDRDGSVLVADTGNHALRRIDPNGVVTTVARRGMVRPTDVVVLPDGAYAVADPGGDAVLHVTADGEVERLAGTGVRGFRGDGGPADAARLNAPAALGTSPVGLLVADTGNAVVRRIADDGTIATVAGAFRRGSPRGAYVRVPLESPRGITATSAGDLVVADGARLWSVATTGAVRALAGTGRAGFDGDGTDPLGTSLSAATGLATASDDTVIAADTGNDRIRGVSPLGTLATVAGSDRPDVRLTPVALAPFRRQRPRTTPISHPYYGGGGAIQGGGEYGGGADFPAPAPPRAPSCVKPGIRANVLKLRPYSQPSIRSAAAPVVLELGTSIDVHLTGFAVRRGRDYGRVELDAPAGVRTIHLRGRLEPGRYWAVVLGRSDDGTRACDARRLRVTAR